jgi:hypothetical protein
LEAGDNQNGNLASQHWHHCRGVIVVQGLIEGFDVAARQSGVGRRLSRGRPATASLAFERGAAAVALDVHFEDGGVMDEAFWENLGKLRSDEI